MAPSPRSVFGCQRYRSPQQPRHSALPITPLPGSKPWLAGPPHSSSHRFGCSGSSPYNTIGHDPCPPGSHEPPRRWPVPVRALNGATSYWACVMANPSGHMSHHGAQGTVWTLVAPNELARLASLQPVATRRLPRVQDGRPRTASACQGGVDRPLEEAPVGQANTIGLDIAKRVFQAHGADASGRVVFRKRLVRAKVLEFFAAQPPCTVAMEACAGAHHWARELGKLGHTVRLIPPAYVKPSVKRQKNDRADAEAICEAAQRPSMRFVPVKSEEQQANGVVFRARDLLVRQRTQCINALRGHRSEYGCVFPQGITHAEAVIAHVEDPDFALQLRAV